VSDQFPPPPETGPVQPPAPPTYPGYPPQGQRPPLGAYPPPAPAYGPVTDQRPGTVTGAAVTTIVVASLGLALFTVIGLLAVSGIDEFIEGMSGSPGLESYTESEIRDMATFLGIVFLAFAFWSLVTIVTASLSLRRHNWARIITIITAGGWAALGVFNIVTGNGAGILTLAIGVTVVILYLVGQANAWYNGKNVGSRA